MWSFLAILIAIGVIWLVLRKSSVGPRAVLLAALLALVALLLLFLADRGPGRSGPPPSTGGAWLEPAARPSIDLSADLKTLDGRNVGLKDYRGKVVFLNFWATWCRPCLVEMPSMAKLHERFSKQGLQMVAISDEDLETVRAHARRKGYPFTVLVDPERTLAARLGIQGVPTTFILDKEGRLIYQHVGTSDWDSTEVRQKIEALLTQ